MTAPYSSAASAEAFTFFQKKTPPRPSSQSWRGIHRSPLYRRAAFPLHFSHLVCSLRLLFNSFSDNNFWNGFSTLLTAPYDFAAGSLPGLLRQFLSRLTDDVIHISFLRRIPDDAVIHAHLPVCLADSNLPGKTKRTPPTARTPTAAACQTACFVNVCFFIESVPSIP